MKIGILTLPLHVNYGGILQAYALQTVLANMGHEVVIFDTDHKQRLPLLKMPFSYAKRFVMKYILKKHIRIFSEWYYNKEYPAISQYTQTFIDKYIHTQRITTLVSLSNKGFDCIISGSDQVWRPAYFIPMMSAPIEDAFLKFTEFWDIKRIAYAASFGSDAWEYTRKQTIRCAVLAKKFDWISVREDSAVKLCAEYLGVNANQTLDPTLLLDKRHYESIADISNAPKSNGNLLVYVLDINPQIEQTIKLFAAHKGLVPFYTCSRVEDPTAPIEQRIQKPVETWIRGFMDAQYVITDSFHGCVFSIIFNKPFVTVGNTTRGQSRFSSLLKIFGLENRMIKSADEIMQLPEIDWNHVNTIHEKLKTESINLLKNALQ